MYGYLDVSKIFRIKELYTASKQSFEEKYYFIGETHDFWEIVVVTEGEIGVTAGKNVYSLKKGQAIIHEPMEFHRLWTDGHCKSEVIIFSFSAYSMPKYLSKIVMINDLDEVKSLLKEILNHFEVVDVNIVGIKDKSKINYISTIKKLENFILKYTLLKDKKGVAVNNTTATNYTKIVNVLENNFEKRLTVSDIARLCNMSEVNLKKTFSKYSGIGVMNYFNKLKIEKSLEYFEKGMTVQETASILGFSNQNYFSTVFKRIKGYPPTELKR